MKNKKKKSSKQKILLLPILLILMISFGIGGTIAYFIHSDDDTNILNVGFNEITLEEDFEPPAELTEGENEFKKEVKVTNTGNVDCYVRVYLGFSDSYAGNNSTLSSDGTNFYTTEEYKTTNVPDGWIYVSREEDPILGDYFYYTEPLAPGESTTNILEAVKTTFPDADSVKDFDIIVQADSVQSLNKHGEEFTGPDAWEDCWHEFIDYDAEEPDIYHTVTFVTDGGSILPDGSSTPVSTYTVQVLRGETVTPPVNDPVKDSHSFKGWYKQNGVQEYDFETPITSDKTIIAVWTEKTAYENSYVRPDNSVVSYNRYLTDENDEVIPFGRTYDFETNITTMNKTISSGEMNAVQNAGFENSEDASDGIVKLTFDVTGKPVTGNQPVDVLIIADESGSLNMYGRSDVTVSTTDPKKSASYMPCLNKSHYYLVDGLQGEINELARLRGLDVDTSKSKYQENDPVFVNPYGYADNGVYLSYSVFTDWSKYPEMLREMITDTGVVIPDGFSDNDLFRAFFSDWDTVAKSSNGQITFTGLKGWNPDKNHYHSKIAGEDGMIPYVENQDKITETQKLYSYWSPDTGDNPYKCLDRMMVEKDGIKALVEQIYDHHKDSRVAYVGFTYAAYPSLTSYGIENADSGFCSLENGKIPDELMEIIENTNGHDYTNYVHAIWTAKKLIEDRKDTDRPVRVVFLSDGAPSRTSAQEKDTWNILDVPVKDVTDGDCLGYNEIYYGDVNHSHVSAAEYAADLFCQYFENNLDTFAFYTVGFSTNDTADALLDAMAGNGFFDCADLEEFLDSIDIIFEDMVNSQYPNGVITNVIGEGFELIVEEEHPFTIGENKYESIETLNAAPAVEVNDSTIKWTIESVRESGIRSSFYTKLKDSFSVPEIPGDETSAKYSYALSADVTLTYKPVDQNNMQEIKLNSSTMKLNAEVTAENP